MILYQPDTQQPITSEYLASLSDVERTDLLLNRTKLFTSAMTAQIKDKEYIENLEKDIKAIHIANRSTNDKELST